MHAAIAESGAASSRVCRGLPMSVHVAGTFVSGSQRKMKEPLALRLAKGWEESCGGHISSGFEVGGGLECFFGIDEHVSDRKQDDIHEWAFVG